MSNKEKEQKDNRPSYIAPQVIRLNDISTGIGGGCGPGNSPASGRCDPTGNGPGIIACINGNGAKGACSPAGQGVK